MLLGQMLTPKDLRLCQSHFSWDIAAQEIELYSEPNSDTWGSSRGNVWSSKRLVRINTAKIPIVDGHLNLWEVGARSTILHELHHVTEAKRGFWVRLKERLANWFQSYADREHEIEAKLKADTWAKADAKL